MSSSVIPTRPKPWELHGSASNSTRIQLGENDEKSDGASEKSIEQQPALPPQRPAAIETEAYQQVPYYNTYGAGSLGYNNNNGGNLFVGGNSVTNPYMGSYQTPFFNGLGTNYGNTFGSLYGNSNNNNAYVPGNSLSESTQATFQLIEGLVGAVAGFAQMLESTYMATHNSFFTMISVAEQFNYLKEAFGSFFGIFTIIKAFKKILHKLTRGRLGTLTFASANSSQKASKLTEEFLNYNTNQKDRPTRKMSWKPLFLFMVSVFGFPYVLNKFIARFQHQQKVLLGSTTSINANEPIDPSKLEFARAIYDFVPENARLEVMLKKGDLMAIIDKHDIRGKESEWWRVRTKNGQVGYVPYNYVEIIKKRSDKFQNITS